MTFEEIFHTWALNLEGVVTHANFSGNKIQVSVIQKNDNGVLSTVIEGQNKKSVFFRLEASCKEGVTSLDFRVNNFVTSLPMIENLVSGFAAKETINIEDIEEHTQILWNHVCDMDGESLSYLNKGFFF